MAKRSKRNRMRDAAERYKSSSGSGVHDQPLENTLGETAGAQPITEVACPDCAETIKAAAKVCRFCGWTRAGGSKGHKGGVSRRRPRASSSGRILAAQKSPAVAALLAFLVNGLGHIYAGQVGVGILVFCLGYALFVLGFFEPVFFFFWLILVIAQICMAYSAANAWNRRLGGRW